MDQINNLPSKQTNSLPPVSKPQTSAKKSVDVDSADLSFDTLLRRLQEMPEVREEVVEQGKAQKDDPEFPNATTTKNLAQHLIQQRIVWDSPWITFFVLHLFALVPRSLIVPFLIKHFYESETDSQILHR